MMMMLGNKRITIKKIDEVGISYQTVYRILSEDLGLKKFRQDLQEAS